MRLAKSESVILTLLAARGDAYGLELVEASRGKLKRGGIYVTLGRMEEKGYIRSTLDTTPGNTGGLPRRRYKPTPLGRRVLSVWTHAADQLRPEFAR